MSRAILLVLLALAPRVDAADLVIRGASVVDGTGAPPRGPLDVLVRGGRIAAVGAVPADAAAATIDARGATVLPGLVDAHVHMAAAPGAAFRGDDADTARELTRVHLRAYLASGVTTVLDPGSPASAVRMVQDLLAGGAPGPRYLTTGPLVHAPDGYPGGEQQGVVRSADAVGPMLDELVRLGAVGVKVATQSGHFAPMPAGIRDALLAGVRTRGLPLYVHATNERDAAVALDWGAHAIMHGPLGGAAMGDLLGSDDLSDAFVARMATSGAYLVSTLSLLDTWPGAFDLARLDDPALVASVPPPEMASARDPDAVQAFAVTLIGWQTPWVPALFRPAIGRRLWSPENLAWSLGYTQRNVLRLFRAGVPVVAGTDAPSPWPDAVFHFHGLQSLRELELLVGAGLSPGEAIAAATRTAARMLGLEGEIGTIAPGMRADLLVVDGDPTRDIGALRRIRAVVQGGRARTPAEWLAAAADASSSPLR